MVLSLLLGSIEALSAQKFKKIRLAYTGFDVGVTISLIGKDTGLFKKAGLDVVVGSGSHMNMERYRFGVSS